MGPSRLHPKVLREVAVVLTGLLSSCLKACGDQGIPLQLEKRKHCALLQKRTKGLSRTLQPSQSQVSAQENHGVSSLVARLWTQEGEESWELGAAWIEGG